MFLKAYINTSVFVPLSGIFPTVFTIWKGLVLPAPLFSEGTAYSAIDGPLGLPNSGTDTQVWLSLSLAREVCRMNAESS